MDLKKLRTEARGLELLYVEDDEDIRSEFTNFLANFFDKICVCKDALEGLQKARERSFHLVISDIEMPYMSGLEMVKRLKEQHQKLAVILVSAHRDQKLIAEALALGIDSYIFKPFDSQTLLQTLQKEIQKILRES